MNHLVSRDYLYKGQVEGCILFTVLLCPLPPPPNDVYLFETAYLC